MVKLITIFFYSNYQSQQGSKRPGQWVGQLTLRFGAEVRNCIGYGVGAYMSDRCQRIVVRPTTARAISTDIIRQTIVQHLRHL